MRNYNRPADITVRSGWFIIILLIFIGAGLLFLGLDIFNDGDIFIALFCLLFCGIAFYGSMTVKAMTTKVFIAEQEIQWTQKGLLGNVEKKVVSFTDVQSIDFETMSGGSHRVSQRIVIQCEGFALPLSPAYSSGKHGLDSMRDKLFEALTMEPPLDKFDSDLKVMIKAGNKIAAIRYIQERKGLSLTQAKLFLDKEIDKEKQ